MISVHGVHKHRRRSCISEAGEARSRAYSTALSRWLQDDPIGYVEGLNLFLVDLSNPAIHLDPSGNNSETPPATQPLIPTTGNEPKYEPDKWNEHGSNARLLTNCYTYALNQIPSDADVAQQRTWMKPGLNGGGTTYAGNIKTCEGMIKLAQADGLRKLDGCDGKCGPKGRRVALFVSESNNDGVSNDFHWVRQDADGFWSHKLGAAGVVTNLDADKKPIRDPAKANLRFKDAKTVLPVRLQMRELSETKREFKEIMWSTPPINYKFCACFEIDDKVRARFYTREEFSAFKSEEQT